MRALTGSGWLIGRWLLYLTGRAIVLEHQPRRSCPMCGGRGGWYEAETPGSEDGYWESCPCTARLLRLAIPYRRGRAQSDEPPF